MEKQNDESIYTVTGNHRHQLAAFLADKILFDFAVYASNFVLLLE